MHSLLDSLSMPRLLESKASLIWVNRLLVKLSISMMSARPARTLASTTARRYLAYDISNLVEASGMRPIGSACNAAPRGVPTVKKITGTSGPVGSLSSCEMSGSIGLLHCNHLSRNFLARTLRPKRARRQSGIQGWQPCVAEMIVRAGFVYFQTPSFRGLPNPGGCGWSAATELQHFLGRL